MSHRSQSSNKKIKEVISYTDDVFTWVYMDQIDRVIRYEAFVVGYDQRGRQSTLEFVLEEGVLDNVHEVPPLWNLLRRQETRAVDPTYPPVLRFTLDGRIVTSSSLQARYRALTPAQLKTMHTYFNEQEKKLKNERRLRWTRMLKALGYDVISSL